MEQEIVTKNVYKLEEVAQKCGFKSGANLLEFLHKYKIFNDGFPAHQFQYTCFEPISFDYYDHEIDRMVLDIAAVIVTPKGVKFIKDLYKIIEKNLHV